MSTQTIAVAMSGGVDSSTVAAMLRAEGHNVVGLTMQLWNQRRLAGHEGMPEQVQGRCCSIDDVYDARRVAEDLDIPYYVVNHEERFEREVVRPFIDEYLSGRTPIPCSLCNNHLKFDQLLITARQIGADMLATGHYARCEFDAQRNRWLLRRAADPAKDQTYFLFGLTQEQLSRTLFPLGHMNKPQVRELAREHHLALAEKPDSQEICFVPGGDYKRFIDAYLNEQGEQLPDTSGDLVTTSGKVLGHHEGIHNFTVGQRKGLGVATGSPLYVININGAEGRVTVGGNDDLLSRALIAHKLNWIAIDGLHDSGASDSNASLRGTTNAPMRVLAKIRHRHEPAPAVLENAPNGEVRVTFDQPQRAITPGQAVVFYQDDLVVGGGWIAETSR
ncbi:MAG: tRNA (5-methylaminomethyl-2-thiouridylate)-methyltransferase [Candidatus Angelobacter sp.]|nr:tRNA (5-methylaminomethyl-2-thiouridylate)-methyltransferase [Candidatus Angelobacter sp.]